MRNNVEKKKENITPTPILSFLNNFKPKKTEIKQQESEFKVEKNEKNEKEIFMSQFNKIKNIFEKEKEKIQNNCHHKKETCTLTKDAP